MYTIRHKKDAKGNIWLNVLTQPLPNGWNAIKSNFLVDWGGFELRDFFYLTLIPCQC